MMFSSFGTLGAMAGVCVTENVAATSMPSKTPRTDDMRAMVDDLIARGEFKRKPSAFSLPDGSLVVHPAIMCSLRDKVERRIEALAFWSEQ